MRNHQTLFASDWHRVTSLYSVRFEMEEVSEGVLQVQAIWSTKQPPPPRAMEALSAKFHAALNAFITTAQHSVSDGSKA